ncbi:MULTISPECIES: hypothetical protein [Prochlorococcus]|uniref:hypothetical protein n=1 Tax=Prochlorococcus TaxID=1218 RepID=UPI0007BB624C|nr:MULTISPECIES: hypothetical protein [Prochlorococcus]KZR62630.1 hypothetical protein PMIT1312_02096 [Prochlorococcus marinus str. MIT 1312]KZR80889.1 hypothetical protein PMIT1327_01337 [Prochlorococcus marinus str. MIT 1327]NMO83722.1 hypothetical protein [Prochlorococcus sp. P1344]NMP05524.1 hypothetical protein [Prochlorococcus sp. P1361]NMP14491.1 hypothetical protein [Prochlorococcus sp.P1363]
MPTAASCLVVRFCFGEHAELLNATTPQMTHSFHFCGACLNKTRPGVDAPRLELLPLAAGRLSYLSGTADSWVAAC